MKESKSEPEKCQLLTTDVSAEGYSVTLKQQVYAILHKYPYIKPLEICKILGINYRQRAHTVRSYKYEWKKSQLKIRHGLNCLNFHAVKIFGYGLRGLDRRKKSVNEAAVSKGWVQTRMRNRALLWVDPLGRILWFETGRIVGQVKKPVNKGKILQLLANAFCWTGLIKDITVFEKWADSFRLKGAHLVYDTGEPLPYARISLLKESNGIIVKTGDKTHPTSIEIEFVYPDWLERLELLTSQNIKVIEANTKQAVQFNEFLKDLSKPKPLSKRDDMVI